MARPAARIHDAKYAAVLARGSQFYDRKIVNPLKLKASGLSMGLTREEALVLNLVRQLGADGVLLQAAPLAKILIGKALRKVERTNSFMMIVLGRGIIKRYSTVRLQPFQWQAARAKPQRCRANH